jgi:putative polyketide hydroxylase
MEYRFAAQLASAYQHSGWFLVGDAAHRMTPRGGTGMNTAIQDSYNLGWKLAWVLRGWAEPSLLDTYEHERRPIGQHNVSRSADPGGARRDAEDALEWDLAGRLPHCWTSPAASTLDLVGKGGLTLFTGPDRAGLIAAQQTWPWRAPLSVIQLETGAAQALRIQAGRGFLVRPDAFIVTPRHGLASEIDPGNLPLIRVRD